jgi:HK97 gp10 family phage protein
MAKEIKFEIKGIEEANKMLSQLPKSISNRVLYDINKNAAKIVKKELEESAPDSNSDKKSKNKIASNVIIKKSETGTGVNVGFAKKTFWVLFQEFGTVVRSLSGKGKYKKGTNRGKIERKPFVQVAHNRVYPRVVDFFVNNYLKIVNQSLKRQSRKLR